MLTFHPNLPYAHDVTPYTHPFLIVYRAHHLSPHFPICRTERLVWPTQSRSCKGWTARRLWLSWSGGRSTRVCWCRLIRTWTFSSDVEHVVAPDQHFTQVSCKGTVFVFFSVACIIQFSIHVIMHIHAQLATCFFWQKPIAAVCSDWMQGATWRGRERVGREGGFFFFSKTFF